jgi:hypothetical protein
VNQNSGFAKVIPYVRKESFVMTGKASKNIVR